MDYSKAALLWLMSPNSVILYIFYSKTIKQCLAFIADLKINPSGYKEETEVTVPIVCLWLELEKLNFPPPNLSLHIYSSYREITVFQSFLAQFPSSIITGDLSNMCMVHTHTQGNRRRAIEKNWAEFCLYKWEDIKNAIYARHSDYPLFNFHEILQSRY